MKLVFHHLGNKKNIGLYFNALWQQVKIETKCLYRRVEELFNRKQTNLVCVTRACAD